ncbi:MAG: efflux RND transporter periplasmic adaptor subunit [Bacteroides sp.]
MQKAIYFALCSALFLGACKPNASSHTEQEQLGAEAEHDHEHGDNVVILSPEKAQAAGVESAIIQAQPFHHVIKTGGKVLAAQGDESVVVATIPGVVSLSKNMVEGVAVQNGQSLATLSSKNLQDGDPAQRARINYEIAKKEYQRVLPLIESKIVTQKEFARIQQEYENARISYEASAKGHTQGGQQMKAPISGYIKALYVKEGDYVEVGQALFSITKNKRLYLKAEVSERYYHQLKEITSANFKFTYHDQIYKLKDLSGEVISYGKTPSENGYLLPITFAFNNVGSIVPDSFVEVYLLSKEKKNAIALPYTAITEEQGLYFAYKQLCEEEYEKVEIKLGVDNGESIEIKSGIQAGDRIVIKGAQQVKLASATNAIPAHTHEH